MPLRHFYIACGAPMNLTRHPSPESILQSLVAATLLERREVEGTGECVCYAKRDDAYLEVPIADMRARLIAEKIMLSAVKQWARTLALGSWDKFEMRDTGDMPQVGTFGWDLAAPSYLSPLLSGVMPSGKPKPGFIVCDLLLGRTQTASGLAAFLRKCATLRSLSRVGRTFFFFVAEGYSDEAFRAARSAGIVPATTESLFGAELARAFTELVMVLKKAATAAVDPGKFEYLFSQLGKIEGAANSLRGALFEFVVADLVRKLWGAEVRMNYKFREAGKDIAEVDVLALLPGRMIYFIECKGNSPYQLLGDEEVKQWLTSRIPTIRRKVLEHPDWKNLDMHFELWVSGNLSDEASRMIAEHQARLSTNKYTIQVRNGLEIGRLADELKDPTLRHVLHAHFLQHPLAAEELLAPPECVTKEASTPSVSDHLGQLLLTAE
jgi:hypothetical protein